MVQVNLTMGFALHYGLFCALLASLIRSSVFTHSLISLLAKRKIATYCCAKSSSTMPFFLMGCSKNSSWNSDARRLEPSRAHLDEANRRSTAGGRAEEIQRGRRKPSSKPRVKPMQSAERRRCNRRKIPANVARDGELEKRGVRRGESRNGCLPPAGTFVRGEKRCIAYRVHQRFCMPIDTLHTRGIALLKDIY